VPAEHSAAATNPTGGSFMRDALGGVQSALVLGGRSDIAVATMRKLVADRCRTVVLAGRDV
jgi:decaprenylphospho-beta-D-erythro-pentofuranosid-2-ulose 2-reductase